MPETHSIIESKIRVNYRPLKVAYFIRDDDEKTFEKVVRFCCTQWGGIKNPIITVNEKHEIARTNRYILSINPPDMFVSFLNDKPSPEEPLRKILSEIIPNRTINILHGPHFEVHDQSIHALAAILPVSTIQANAPLGTLQGKPPSLKAHTFEGTYADKLSLLAMFGGIYPGQEDYYETTIPIERPIIKLDMPDLWQHQMNNSLYGSVVNLTSSNLSFLEYTNSGNHSFQVIITDCIGGMALYWNLRSIYDSMAIDPSRRRTWLFPTQLLEKNGLERMIEAIRSVPALPDATYGLDITFVSWRDENAQLVKDRLSTLQKVELGPSKIKWNHWFGHPERVPRESDPQRTILYRFIRPTLPSSIKEGVRPFNTPERLELRFGADELPLSPPSSFTNRSFAALAVDFIGDAWERYPRDPSVACQIHPQAWFSHYGLTVPLNASETRGYLGITLPSDKEACDAFFKARNFTARISSSGRYATAFLDLIGGMSQITHLASVPVFRLLDCLAIKSTKKVAQRILKQLQPGVSSEEELIRILNDVEVIAEWKTNANTLNVLKETTRLSKTELFQHLTRLSKLEMLRRGVLVTCDNCGVPTWHVLSNLSERIACPGCASIEHLPVEYPSGSGNEIQWQYTLNTLVNRVMDQDVLPHLLALHHLTKGVIAHALQPGVELLRNGSKDAEVELDFIFVTKQHLHGGECKAGGVLTDKDFETAKKAQELGFHDFSFCTIRTFESETRARILALTEELKSRQRPMNIKVIEGQELLGGVLS